MIEKQRRIDAAVELERQRKSLISCFGQFSLMGSLDLTSLTDPSFFIEIETIADSSVVFLVKLNSSLGYRIRLPWKNTTVFNQESLIKDSLQGKISTLSVEFGYKPQKGRTALQHRTPQRDLVIPWPTLMEGLSGLPVAQSPLMIDESGHQEEGEQVSNQLRDNRIQVKTSSGTETRMSFILANYKHLEIFFKVSSFHPKSFWGILLYKSVFIKGQTTLLKFNNQEELNLEARKGSYIHRSELSEWRTRLSKLVEIPPPKNLLLLKMSEHHGNHSQNPYANKEAAMIWNYYDLNGVKLNYKRADYTDEVLYDNSPANRSESGSEESILTVNQGEGQVDQRESYPDLQADGELGEEEVFFYKDAPVMKLNFCTFVTKFDGEFWVFLFSVSKEHYSSSMARMQQFKRRRDLKPLFKNFDIKIFSGQKQSHVQLDLENVDYLRPHWNADPVGMTKAIKHYARKLKPSDKMLRSLTDYFTATILRIDYQGIIYRAPADVEESREHGKDEDEVSDNDSQKDLVTDAIKLVPMSDEREEEFQQMIRGKEQSLRMAVKDTLFVHYNTVKRVQQRERLFMTVKYRSKVNLMQTRSIQ
jgi:hypothetical protein